MVFNILGTVFLIMLAIVVYLIIVAVRTPPKTETFETITDLSHAFNFETAPEIMAYPAELNPIESKEDDQLIIKNNYASGYWEVYWDLDKEILERGKGKGEDGEKLILRIYEASDMLRHNDIDVGKINGCCRLYLTPNRAYYASMGLMKQNRFYPLVFSNTVIPSLE